MDANVKPADVKPADVKPDELAVARKTIVQLQERIARLIEHGTDCQVGDEVEVVNLTSWEGWHGKLIRLEGMTAHIELVHKKSGTKVWTTSAVNVRKYTPKK